MSFPFTQRYRKTLRKARYKTKKPPISWWLSVRHAGIEPASMDLESMAHPSIPMAHKKRELKTNTRGSNPTSAQRTLFYLLNYRACCAFVGNGLLYVFFPLKALLLNQFKALKHFPSVLDCNRRKCVSEVWFVERRICLMLGPQLVFPLLHVSVEVD